ncbi:protein toll-like [Centruroides vittatus]|uniref:protein toll-like n=1 Tax=Centruroides vittatus TaxID=120091 RepID=UPI00350F8E92
MQLYEPTPSMFKIIILSLSISIIQSHLCRVRLPINYACFCNNHFNGESNAAWVMKCIDKRSHEDIFTIVHSLNLKVSIYCYQQITYEYIFEEYEFPEIHHFKFINCPKPSKSFSEVLKKHDVKVLEFIDQKNLKELEDYMFTNMSSLEHLILNNNRIQSLSTNLFNNFPNLKSLQLNHNSINSLPDDVFFPLKKLTDLKLTGNKLSTLPKNIFYHLSNLEILFLNINKLTMLHDDIFLNLNKLKILNLSQNKLKQLPDNIFNNLTSVNCIRLEGNDLQLLSKKLFIKNKNLEKLDMSYNPKIELPKNLFFDLYKLKDLRLHNCNLFNISRDTFSHMSQLQTLHLWNNRLKILPKELFSKNLDLKHLNLDFNDLEKLPNEIFENQFKLSTLKLSKNNIKELSEEIFQNLVELEKLNLDSNLIFKIHKNSFKNLQKLSFLDLSHNNISFLPNEISFSSNRNLKTINFSFNNLTFIPYTFWSRYNVKTLNITNNQLNSFSIPVINSNTVVFLQNNKIKNISIKKIKIYHSKNSSLLNFENLSHFYFQGNPLHCDCNLQDFINYIRDDTFIHSVSFPDIEYLKCYSPMQLNNKNILSISDDSFTCQIKNDCPAYCSCYMKYDSSVVVNCSNSHLIALPSPLPFNSSIVYLDNNNIVHLDLNNSQWENVSEIYISNNKLKTIANVKMAKNLKLLNLQNNSLTTFDNITESNYSLYLGNNPWICDCSTLLFKNWLNDNYQKIHDINNITCNFLELGNISITKISPNRFCNIYQMQKIIIVLCLCFLLIFLLIMISTFYYQYRQIIIAYMYIHFNTIFHCLYNENELEEDKLYDAFISYSSADQDIVACMIEELENTSPYYKLCIQDRDWLAGNFINCNIISSVKNSKKTILILSEDSLKSLWCQTEFRVAYHQTLEDKIDRLIIVIRGQCPMNKCLDKDLKFFLSTKTYLKWGEKWFWEKLRYAMPHRKRKRHVIKNSSRSIIHDDNLIIKFNKSFKSFCDKSEEEEILTESENVDSSVLNAEITDIKINL